MSDITVGVDVGTTAVKVVAYRGDRSVVADASRSYELRSPQPGFAEQDADAIVDAALDALAEVTDSTGGVRAVGLCTAMHSLIGLDRDGRPLTPCITYADTRAWPQALRIRDDGGAALYRATGTPVHPMAPLAKLRWFAEERPRLFASVARWVSIKEHLLARLTGATVVDRSVASTTGMLDLASGGWHAGALELAGIDADRLGEPVATTHVVDGLRDDVRAATGLAADTPVVVGATDGVLANVGVGAVTDGTAALTIGTSGAIRMTVGRPRTDDDMRTFCYALTDDRWVLGGAVSNGGLLLRWLADEVLGEPDLDRLGADAAQVPPGSGGVLVLPYLTGERAPRWRPLRDACVFGLRIDHDRRHVVRAAMEGVALQLRLVADALHDVGGAFDTVRATGGFVASDLWVRIVAEVLGVDVELPDVHEGAAHGAALLARVALGDLDGLDAAASDVPVDRTVEPDPGNVDVYTDVARRYAELVERLEPLLTAD